MNAIISKISSFVSTNGKTIWTVNFKVEHNVLGMKVSKEYARLSGIVEEPQHKVGDSVVLPAHKLVTKTYTNKEGEEFSINWIAF